MISSTVLIYSGVILRFLIRLSDHTLVGHVMNTSTVANKFECHQKCIGNNNCKSFNVHPGVDITKRVCDLNNKTREMKPGNYIRKNGSSYFGHIEVSSVLRKRNVVLFSKVFKES